MTLILGLSGRKQSGKNTCLNWIMANYVVGLGLADWARLNDKGQLLVPAETEEGVQTAILDVEHPAAAPYLAEYVWPFVKQYSFATPLKSFCMQVFGLTYEQAHGTNEQKDTPTSLRWEDMPVSPRDVNDWLSRVRVDSSAPVPLKTGAMTGREVLQYFGTQIGRQMWDNCWVDATIRKIHMQQPQLAIITDVRFPNEVKGIQDAGGKVLRFTRAPFKDQDEHASETALDGYEGFDAIIDNADMSIPEQNCVVTQQLLDWQYVEWQVTDNYSEVDAQ